VPCDLPDLPVARHSIAPGSPHRPGLPALPRALGVQQCPRQRGGPGGCRGWCWPSPSLPRKWQLVVRVWIQMAALRVGCKGSSGGFLSELQPPAGFALELEAAQVHFWGAVCPRRGRTCHLSEDPTSPQPAFSSFCRRNCEEAAGGRCTALRGTRPCRGMVAPGREQPGCGATLKDMEGLECVQSRATGVGRCLEHKFGEERLRAVQSGEEEAEGGPHRSLMAP